MNEPAGPALINSERRLIAIWREGLDRLRSDVPAAGSPAHGLKMVEREERRIARAELELAEFEPEAGAFYRG